MERIRTPLASIEVKLADRGLAVKKTEEWAVGGAYTVQAIFGLKGYGRTTGGHLFALASFEGVGRHANTMGGK